MPANHSLGEHLEKIRLQALGDKEVTPQCQSPNLWLFFCFPSREDAQTSDITVEAVPRQHPAAGVHGRPRPQPRPLPCYAWRSRQLLSRCEDPELVRQDDVNEGARTHRVVSRAAMALTLLAAGLPWTRPQRTPPSKGGA